MQRAQLGGFHAKPPRQAVIVAGAVDDDKIAPVAARQHIIAGRFKRRPETLPVVGALPRRLGVGLDGLGGQCRFRRRGMSRASCGRRSGRSCSRFGDKDALAALEVESDLKRRATCAREWRR